MSSIPAVESILKPNAHKRKLSYVCIPCRKCKTKCDKQKPTCSRCAELGLYCSYDVEKQLTEDPSHKIQKLEGLEKELQYWREKTKELELLKYQDLERSPLVRLIPASSIYPNVSSQMYNLEVDEIELDRYGENPPHMFFDISEHEDAKGQLILNHIIRDRYISPLIENIFETVDADLPPDKRIPAQRGEINELKFEILENKFYMECQHSEYLPNIKEFITGLRNNQEKSVVTRTGFFFALVVNSIDSVCLEDINPHEEYSSTLKEIIEQCEKHLPSYEAIEFYKLKFYTHIYPLVPVIEISIFEECIAEIVQKHPAATGKVKLCFGKYHLRHKLTNLAILLLILTVSQFHIGNECPEEIEMLVKKESQISSELLFLSQVSIIHLDITHHPEEQHISYLLLLWYASVLDLNVHNQTTLLKAANMLLSLILSTAMKLGFNRDPEAYYQFKEGLVDKRLINYRRKVTLCIMPVVTYHIHSLSLYPTMNFGLFKNILDTDTNTIPEYLTKVASNMVESNDFEIEVHRVILSRHILSGWIDRLNKLSKCKNAFMKLDEIDEISQKVVRFLETNFPLNDDTQALHQKQSLDLGYKVILLDWTPHMIGLAIAYRLEYYTTILQLECAVMYSLEQTITPLPANLPILYQQRILNSTTNMITVFDLSSQYEKSYKHLHFSNANNRFLNYLVQSAVNNNVYGMFSLYLRFEHVVYLLHDRASSHLTSNHYQADAFHETQFRIMSHIKDLYCEITNQYYTFIEHRIGFSYYNMFRSWLVLRRLQAMKKDSVTLSTLLTKTETARMHYHAAASSTTTSSSSSMENDFSAPFCMPSFPSSSSTLEHISAIIIVHSDIHTKLVQLLEKSSFSMFKEQMFYLSAAVNNNNPHFPPPQAFAPP